MNLLSPERLNSLALAALAAPSADNHHQFRLQPEASEGSERLHLIATEALLQASPGRWILASVSVGAVIENLILRGQALGLRLVLLAPEAHTPRAVLARFCCEAVPAHVAPTAAAIDTRRSNRRPHFRGPAMDASLRAELSQLVAEVEGCQLSFFDDPRQRAIAVRLVQLAERERFRNRGLHDELFSSVRFDVGWASPADEGLPPGSLGLAAFERPMFPLLRHWKLQRVLNLLGTHHFLAFRGASLPCRLAPHVVAITSTGPGASGAQRAGRALQRLWLRTTTAGLSLQVLAAPALYSISGAVEGIEALTAALKAGWKPLCGDAQPYVLARIGHAAPMAVHAGRPAPATVLPAA